VTTRLSTARGVTSIAALVLLLSAAKSSADYQVTIDTSALAASSVSLAFDFIDGGPPSNSIRILNFSTDGTLGTITATGGVSGTLPSAVTLTDSSFFNEYLQSETLGNKISFTVAATSNAPSNGAVPDTFSFFLLSTGNGLPVVNTTDPTGASSLITLQVDGSSSGTAEVYINSSSGPAVTWSVSAVPEPKSWAAFVLGLLSVMVFASRRTRDCARTIEG